MGADAPANEVRVDALRDDRVVPRPQPMKWVGIAIVGVVVVLLAYSVVTNPRFEWDVVFEYFTSESVLRGLGLTIQLTVLAMVIGIVLGVILALMRLSKSRALNVAAGAYVWFFRGTPLLVQLILLYNISALYPLITIQIPFGPVLFSGNMNEIVTPFVAALAALALNEAAFMSEIIRGGLLSVDHGQVEAGRALGMRGGRVTRRIVLPQAMRFIIPPTGNQVMSMLKASSLVSVIALPELLYSVQVVYTRTFQTIPLLLVATIWYLIVTSVLMVLQGFLERRYARGAAQSSDPRAGSFTRLTGIRLGNRRRAIAVIDERSDA